jgi:dihydroflavonol-4-reductase
VSEIKIGAISECYDCSKAMRELGLPQTPAETTIRNAIEWFKANGLMPAHGGTK